MLCQYLRVLKKFMSQKNEGLKKKLCLKEKKRVWNKIWVQKKIWVWKKNLGGWVAGWPCGWDANKQKT